MLCTSPIGKGICSRFRYKVIADIYIRGVNTGFHPQKLPVDELTHILYAFADVDPDGTVKSSDPVIDLEKRYPGDSRQNYTKNAYGVVKQLFLHKKYNRNVKTLLSIGGWNYSPKFVTAAATDASRSKFATSAVKLITDWGFDGIDIDWEYPADDVDKANFVKLVAACRDELDKYSRVNDLRYRFTLVWRARPVHRTMRNWTWPP